MRYRMASHNSEVPPLDKSPFDISVFAEVDPEIAGDVARAAEDERLCVGLGRVATPANIAMAREVARVAFDRMLRIYDSPAAWAKLTGSERAELDALYGAGSSANLDAAVTGWRQWMLFRTSISYAQRHRIGLAQAEVAVRALLRGELPPDLPPTQ